MNGEAEDTSGKRRESAAVEGADGLPSSRSVGRVIDQRSDAHRVIFSARVHSRMIKTHPPAMSSFHGFDRFRKTRSTAGSLNYEWR